MKKRISTTAVVGLLSLAGCRSAAFDPGYGSAQAPRPGKHSTVADRESAVGRADDESDFVDRTREPLRLSGAEPAATPVSQSVIEHLNRGHAEYRENRLQQAKMHYLRVLREQPEHPKAHHLLGIIADKQEDYAAAEHHYLMAFKRVPGDADLLSDVGYSYFLQGRHEEAEQWLNDALRIDPRHSRAAKNLGLLYGTLGDYDRAYAMFRRAGTESDAQDLLARLFPQGRPGGQPQDGQLAGQPNGSATLHAPDPRSGGPQHPIAAHDPGPAASRRSADATQQLRQMMSRAAQRDRAARAGQHAPGGPVHHSAGQSPQQQMQGPAPAAQPHTTAYAGGPTGHSPSHFHGPQESSVSHPPRHDGSFAGTVELSHGHRAAGVPDSELNDAMRGVDVGHGHQQVVPAVGQQHAEHAVPQPSDQFGQPWSLDGSRPQTPANVWPPEETVPPQQPSGAAPGQIQQMQHQQYGQRAIDDASRRALMLGHNAGPGGMFPVVSPPSYPAHPAASQPSGGPGGGYGQPQPDQFYSAPPTTQQPAAGSWSGPAGGSPANQYGQPHGSQYGQPQYNAPYPSR